MFYPVHYYNGKVALVTGAASGIGAELARQLARGGATVVASDISLEGLEKLAREINGALPGRLIPIRADVSKFAEVESAVHGALDATGRLDLLFNNAGVGLAGEVRDVELSDWRPILDVNLWGVIHGVHAALPTMLKQGAGQIVNIASAAGLVPRPGMVPYATVKHAVVGLSMSLRYEVEDLGVKVNVVCPFNVTTSIFQTTVYRRIDSEPMLASIPLRQLSAERCVRSILAGVRRNQAIITMPTYAWFEWMLYRYCPPAAAILLRKRRRLLRAHRLEGVETESEAGDVRG